MRATRLAVLFLALITSIGVLSAQVRKCRLRYGEANSSPFISVMALDPVNRTQLTNAKYVVVSAGDTISVCDNGFYVDFNSQEVKLDSLIITTYAAGYTTAVDTVQLVRDRFMHIYTYIFPIKEPPANHSSK